LRGPGGFLEEGYGGLAYGLESGEAVDDLRLKLGLLGFVGLSWGQGYLYFVFLGDAGDVLARGLAVGCNLDGAD